MLHRTWLFARARLAMARRSGWPVPALLFHAVLGALVALLVRDTLPPFPYALLALSVGAMLLALPILSDLGALLRHDEAEEWASSLPITAGERALARMVQLLVLLGGLVAAWFAPWALLAPAELGLGGRLLLPALGLALALTTASILIWIQQLLLGRLESALVLLETLLVVSIVVALVQLLGHLPELAALEARAPALRWFPPTWFARPLVGGSTWVPVVAATASLAALFRIPPTGTPRARSVRWPERALEPLRSLASRLWVRPEERGAFELVYVALPREREVALRTYPMLGIPLAFLWISARSAHGEGRAWSGDALALLLFTVGVYLPLLLVHVPLSESHAASWLLRTGPCRRSAIDEGTLKALFVRWVLPLYLALLVLGVGLSEGALLARLWLPALFFTLLVLRGLYPRCVRDLPLSTGPEELAGNPDWAGMVAGLAMGSTVVAVLASRFVTWQGGVAIAAALFAAELALERRSRRSAVSARG